MQRLRTAPLLVLIALAAGCGGDESSTATTLPPAASAPPTTAAPATTTPASAPATTTPPPTTAAATTAPATAPPTTAAPATTAPATPEAQLAATALIVFEDFAEGWQSEPREVDDDDGRLIPLVAECAGVDAALIGDDVLGDRIARSPSFSSVDGSFTLEHTVGFAVDADTAALSITQIGGDALPACYAEATQIAFTEEFTDPDPADSLPPGIELGEVGYEVGDASVLGLSAEAVWYHFDIPLTLGTDTIESHLDIVFLRNGAALSQVVMTGFGARFPVEDIGPIVQLADAKLASIA